MDNGLHRTAVSDTSVFDRERHVKYFLRCLKTFLPTGYTSNDSNRMMLACFILSALDILGVLQERTTPLERKEYVDWIYHCQHPEGGFRGFTGTDFGKLRNEDNAQWDPANLAATYFALGALLVLEDDLERVKRRECLRWLAKLQHKDGSFGEVLGEGANIEGGRDVRFCLLAALVRWILRGGKAGVRDETVDFDADALAEFVKSSQTYDGGIAKAPYHEAHGTLSLLNKLQPVRSKPTGSGDESSADQVFIQDTLHWLVYRQTSTMFDDDDEYQIPEDHTSPPASTPQLDHSFQVLGASIVPPAPQNQSSHSQPFQVPSDELQWAGFNGRCNKVADTCYSFWVGGTLGILQKVHLLDFNANRRYLLDKTQHIIGGFGKVPGDPPDIMHSYLGLAALAIMKEPGLKSIDPALCISVSAREHLESLGWRKGEGVDD
ncbi:hypothetical protein MMC24_000951 [Lignoscripta atroalba]|nr:hypothetical protein [Lignoscripta atroalba]